MSIEQYSDEEIVKAFKSFIKKVVENAAIDYSRKVKSRKYKEVLFSELVDEKVSLSNYDNGTFFEPKGITEIISNNSSAKVLKVLTEREKQILTYFYIEKMSIKEIAIKLHTTENCVKSTKSRCLKKLKRKMGE